jgi:hypothetical protein
MRRPAMFLSAFAAILCVIAVTVSAQVVRDGPLPTPLPLFPADNWWNVDISAAPVDANNAGFVAYIGGEGMHPDFGAEGDVEPEIYGIPFISVPGTQPLQPVTWTTNWNQSDEAAPCRSSGYPIPDEAKNGTKWIEGGYAGSADPETSPEGDGDRHMLIVDRDNGILYELFRTFWNAVASRWEADSGAIFPLGYNRRRPDGWTSGDAAGMAILPGLIRHDEAYGTDPIRHAFRVTVHGVCGYVFPASHEADTGCPNAPPLGARMRLKSTKVISGYPAHIQRIFQAMKTYGLIVADTGSDMYVQGTYDPNWDNGDLNPHFDDLTAADFEFIQRGWRPADHPVTREQFAVYMLQALEDRCYDPPAPACGGGFYSDVPCPEDPHAEWIEELHDRGVVSSCVAGLYCPKNALTHAELAMFLVRAKHAPGYSPPDCVSTSPYTDLDCTHPFADWIMRARSETLLFGCAANRFCPDDGVGRLQLEQILANSFYQP